jgi:hypothetical protein
MGTTVAGTGGAGAAADRLSSPYHLIIDSSDALYIADFSNHRVQKFTAASSTGTTVVSQPSGAAGNSLNDLTQPTCLLLDSNKNLYVRIRETIEFYFSVMPRPQALWLLEQVRKCPKTRRSLVKYHHRAFRYSGCPVNPAE